MKIESNSEVETINFGKKILDLYSDAKLIIIKGNIGSGKTVLVKGIAMSLGIKDITSPSFLIKKEYNKFVHYDLFFAENIKQYEFLSLLNEDLENNIVVVEWGEKLPFKKLHSYIFINIKLIREDVRLIEVKEIV